MVGQDDSWFASKGEKVMHGKYRYDATGYTRKKSQPVYEKSHVIGSEPGYYYKDFIRNVGRDFREKKLDILIIRRFEIQSYTESASKEVN